MDIPGNVGYKLCGEDQHAFGDKGSLDGIPHHTDTLIVDHADVHEREKYMDPRGPLYGELDRLLQ
eukprot:2393110-Karenia_brevis.AAC.1